MNSAIVVQNKRRRVTLVAETEVARGRLEGAVKREYVDDDGAAHTRYDREELVEAQLLELRAAQDTPEARALARGLSAASRARVLGAPTGTVTTVRGIAWARYGSLFLVGDGCAVVPRALLLALDRVKPEDAPGAQGGNR